jgi:DNA polymerase-3 subunit alpha
VSQPPEFVHLHTHSEFSLADGALRIKELVKRTKSWGQTALALTDHGNMFGAVTFYSEAKKEGLKPILGVELYLEPAAELKALLKSCETLIPQFHPGWYLPHLVLLAKNRPGHQSLMKLTSSGYTGGLNADDVPVVPRAALQQYAPGDNLFALSACGYGEIGLCIRLLQHLAPQSASLKHIKALDGHEDLVQRVLATMGSLIGYYQSLFGHGFFLELIDNHLPWQAQANRWLYEYATELGIPVVATCDAHYLDSSFVEAHTVLLAIKAGITMSQILGRNRQAYFHLQTPEEMQEKFSFAPDALSNSVLIANACDVKLEFGVYHLPQFRLTSLESGSVAALDESEDATMARLAKEGLEERFRPLGILYGSSFDDKARELYRQRLDYETKTIIQMGFSGYFLIVQDFINWAKSQGIPVGPGRGSGAGSLVAYALRITDLDPIRYNLIFERFLNPERVSMPDFDVDFCQDRRDEVIQYVTKKYGEQNVAQIITFGEMKAKAVLKSVGRAMGLGYNRVDRFTKLIPPELNITLTQAFEKEPRIAQAFAQDEELEKLWAIALKLEGLKSHTSVHAAGVVISDKPMTEYVPIYKSKDDPSLITQYEMKNVEKIGLVKFDFLGLKTLTVIQQAVEIIHRNADKNFNIDLIPTDHKAVFDLISTGKTTGIFQLEGNGMQNLIVKLKPSRFEDIIALVALFRPGPLGSGMVDDFIERKHGRAELTYPHPLTKDILEETYGIILYQEQVQKIATVMASYTLGEADLLRRAMGKKIPEEMQQQKSRFLQGCRDNKIDEKVASDLFDLMAKFAEYGFNKSHSAAYGLVSYQTAYLKTVYPREFMTAILTCDMGNTDKVSKYVDDCRRMGIRVLPPDLNASELSFSVCQEGIRYGLGAIKGIGEMAIQPLLAERNTNGIFTSLGNLAYRVNLHESGKKNLEVLAAAGGFDSFGWQREAILKVIPELIDFSLEQFQAKGKGQRNLFDAFSEPHDPDNKGEHDIWEPSLGPRDRNPGRQPTLKELFHERKLMGHFLSSHPMRLLQADSKAFASYTLAEIAKANFLKVGERRQDVKLLAVVTDVFERLTKTGARAGIIRLEDATGTYETMMFEKDYRECGLPRVDDLILIKGILERRIPDMPARFTTKSYESLAEFRDEHVAEILLRVAADAFQESAPREMLLQMFQNKDGVCPVRLSLQFPAGTVTFTDPISHVEVSDELLANLTRYGATIEYHRY